MTALGSTAMFQHHGGRLAAAAAALPMAPRPWLDLSTGINPRPYPAGRLPAAMRTRLPQPEETAALEAAAARAFGISAPERVTAVPGSEAGLRLLPRLLKASRVAIAGPCYTSHEDGWRATRAVVFNVPFDEIGSADADVLVVINPNNPDGRTHPPEFLLDLARRQKARNGWLVVDEAFADPMPEISVAAHAGAPNEAGRLVVLRSFGKFYGLPGVRLGFVTAGDELTGPIRTIFGDWPVSAEAIAAGLAAYSDPAWAERTRQTLTQGATRLDRVLTRAGLTPMGGTSLFRLAKSVNATACFSTLAEAGILTRIFAHDPTLIRFGLPRGPQQWIRLQTALQDIAR